MSNILSAVENFESKSVEEFALGEEPTNGLKSPSGLRLEEGGNVFKLRNFFVAEPNIFLKRLNTVQKFLAGIVLKHTSQFVKTVLPGIFLGLKVFNFCDRLSDLVGKCKISDLLPPLLVGLVSEAGVVCLLNTITFTKNPLSNVIEVSHVSGEPGNLNGAHFGVVQQVFLFHFSKSSLYLAVGEPALKVDVEVHRFFTVVLFRGLALDLGKAHTMLCQNTKSVCEGAGLVLQGKEHS